MIFDIFNTWENSLIFSACHVLSLFLLPNIEEIPECQETSNQDLRDERVRALLLIK